MRLWILSDLHLEHADLAEPLEPPRADVCVVAGDLCRGIDNGVHWLAQHIAPAMPCIYVAGNHEFYNGSIQEGIAAGRAAAKESLGVHFLENDAVIIGGARFLGATLWTDFRLQGPLEAAMDHARRRMNDCRQIAWQKRPWRRFLPVHAYRLHQDSRAFLETALSSSPMPSVVVTHHLPHPPIDSRTVPRRPEECRLCLGPVQPLRSRNAGALGADSRNRRGGPCLAAT